jgi:hypothetical protein
MNSGEGKRNRSLGKWGTPAAVIVAILMALFGCLTPLLLTELNRQAAIADIERDSYVEFDIVSAPRWGFVSSILPNRYRNVWAVHMAKGDLDDLFPVSNPRTSPFDFGSLECLPELEILSIRVPVIESELLKLPRLSNLKELVLETDQATDAIICHAAEMCPGLKLLVLSSASVTDASITCICRLENLEMLLLDGTKFSATSLRELQVLKHLRAVVTGRTTITQPEMEELQKVLPIEWHVPQLSFGTELNVEDGGGSENEDGDPEPRPIED